MQFIYIVGKITPLLANELMEELDVFRSGPGCSKLTTSLVNEPLKFQMLISQIGQYFLLKKHVRSFCNAKASLIFSTKSFSVFSYKVAKKLNELTS